MNTLMKYRSVNIMDIRYLNFDYLLNQKLAKIQITCKNINACHKMRFLYYFQCDYCDEEPIFGTRWHCLTCQDRSIDFCTDCFVTQAQEENHHSVDHTFIGYRVSTDFHTQSDMESDENDQHEQMQEDSFNEDDSQFFHSRSNSFYDNFNILSNNLNQNMD